MALYNDADLKPFDFEAYQRGEKVALKESSDKIHSISKIVSPVDPNRVFYIIWLGEGILPCVFAKKNVNRYLGMVPQPVRKTLFANVYTTSYSSGENDLLEIGSWFASLEKAKEIGAMSIYPACTDRGNVIVSQEFEFNDKKKRWEPVAK